MKQKVRTQSHRLTTAHLQAAYPFIAESGLGGRGVFIGQDLAGGGAFCYDPFELYEMGVLTDPNMIVMGHIGRGKSSLIKTYIIRQQVFGRRAAVMDPKGEYGDLAAALGVEPVRLSPGGHIKLNPLDTGDEYESNPAEISARQETLLVAVIEAAMSRRLLPAEQTACRLGLDDARARSGTPILPEVAYALLHPSEEAAREVNATTERLGEEGREIALTLKRLCDGDLRGMFDSQTTVRLDWEAPLVVLDLSALHQSAALPILMTCAAAYLQAALARPGMNKRILVLDEAWAVLRTVGIARCKLTSSWLVHTAYKTSSSCIVHPT